MDVHNQNEHLKIIPVMESGQFHDCVGMIASRSCFCSVYTNIIYIMKHGLLSITNAEQSRAS